MLGGTIWLQSSPGKGSVFFFSATFQPSAGASQPEARTTLPPTPLPHPAPRTSTPRRVLLAEDNEVNLTFMTLFMEEAGHQVVTARSGIEVLSLLESGPFDVVLMDVQMPEMDGVEATKKIRGAGPERFNPHIPIIALTAYTMKGDQDRFLEAGMDEYLPKPVDMSRLLELMERLLQERSDARNS